MSSQTKPLEVGVVVGDYEIRGLLGEGTFGTVYAAVHPVIGKRAAVKVLKHEAAADSQTAQRFKGEALAVNAIEHPNIVDIFGFGYLPDGRPYLIMEYLRGSSFEDLLEDRGGRLPVEELFPILHSIALAVDAAHEAGVVHRDLKPDNIFVSRPASGMQVVKVLDFGVAKLMFQGLGATQPGVPIGTPWYMAPEQCFGQEVDHRADVYSFGVMAFRGLTGAFPVDGATYADLIKKHVERDRLLASEADPAMSHFDEVLRRCLAVEAEGRFDSLGAAYTALHSQQLALVQRAPSVTHTSTGPLPSTPILAPVDLGTSHAADSDEEMPTTRVARAARTPGRSQEMAAAEAIAVAAGIKGQTLPGPFAANQAGLDDAETTRVREVERPPADDEGPTVRMAQMMPGPSGLGEPSSGPMSSLVTTPVPPPGSAPMPPPGSGPMPAPGMTTGAPGEMPRLAPHALQQTTLSGSNAELYKIQRRFPGRIVAVVLIVLVLVGVALFFSTGEPEPREQSSITALVERGDNALEESRWSDALAAAQELLQLEPEHEDGTRIERRAREEQENQKHLEAFRAAVKDSDVRAARLAVAAISETSSYRRTADSEFGVLQDTWLANRTRALQRRLKKRRCGKARTIVEQIEDALPDKAQEAREMYAASRCPKLSGKGKRKGKRSDGATDQADGGDSTETPETPASLFDKARAAATRKDHHASFSFCQQGLRKSGGKTRSSDLGFCVRSACEASQKRHARAWYRALTQKAEQRKASAACKRVGISL